jgi:hypothetical protein
VSTIPRLHSATNFRPYFEPRRRHGNPGANGRGRFGVREFVAHPLGRQNFFEQIGQKRDLARQHKVMKRACIGDNKPHSASKAKALQVGSVTIEGARVVAADNAMANQERVKRAACLEAKNLLQFGTGQMPEPKLVERERLEGAPLHLGRRSET